MVPPSSRACLQMSLGHRQNPRYSRRPKRPPGRAHRSGRLGSWHPCLLPLLARRAARGASNSHGHEGRAQVQQCGRSVQAFGSSRRAWLGSRLGNRRFEARLDGEWREIRGRGVLQEKVHASLAHEQVGPSPFHRGQLLAVVLSSLFSDPTRLRDPQLHVQEGT